MKIGFLLYVAFILIFASACSSKQDPANRGVPPKQSQVSGDSADKTDPRPPVQQSPTPVPVVPPLDPTSTPTPAPRATPEAEITGDDKEPGLRPKGMPPVYLKGHNDDLCFDIEGDFIVEALTVVDGRKYPDRIHDQVFHTSKSSSGISYNWNNSMFGVDVEPREFRANGKVYPGKFDPPGVWSNYVVVCDQDGVNIMTMVDWTHFIQRMRIFRTPNPNVFGFQLAHWHEWGVFGTLKRAH